MENKTAVKNKEKYKLNIERAFEEYYNTVYRLAYLRTANAEDAKEVLSEVFLKLVKNKDKIKSEEHLKAWLIRVTINCGNTLLKSAYRLHKAEYTDIYSSPEGVESHNFEVLECVFKLPQNQKTVIYLYYFLGYSVEEISKICAIRSGTVKSRLSRARQTLKEQLKGDVC